MFVKPERPLEDIKTAVFHNPVKAKHLNFSTYIYIFIINQVSVFYQSRLTGISEQPKR